jgi:hypothetical protein
MKFVLLLEDDPRFIEPVKEALNQIDPQLELVVMNQLVDLMNWIKQIVQKGSDAFEDLHPDAKGKENELRIIMSKTEFISWRHIELLRKTREFFIRKKICTAEDPTSFLISSFESPKFDLHAYENKTLQNVIFKPFDKLILLQDLEYALAGRHPPKKHFVHESKELAILEMLKTVPITEISEIGFATINNFTIPIGSIAKYYSPWFEAGSLKSIYAKCYKIEKIEGTENDHKCYFSFYGVQTHQLNSIRRKLKTSKLEIVKSKIDDIAPRQLKALIVDREGTPAALTHAALSEIVQCTYFESRIDLDKAIKSGTLNGPFDIIVWASNKFELAAEGPKKIRESIDKIVGQNKSINCHLYLETDGDPLDARKRESSIYFEDIIIEPFDRLSLKRSINRVFSRFLEAAKLFEPVVTYNIKAELKVANPVESVQLSEAGLILKYYRGIGIGSFREFVFWRADESSIPIIVGNCNYVEVDSIKKIYMNHFVFFGMTDAYLKHIRLWILEHYVAVKQQKAQ